METRRDGYQQLCFADKGFWKSYKTNSQKLEYQDEFINIHNENYWILHSRTIKYIDQNKEEEIQKFIFEDLLLLN